MDVARVDSAYLDNRGFVVPARYLSLRLGSEYAKFLKKLTITYYPKVGPPKTAKMYKLTTEKGIQYIYLPRTLMRLLVPKITGVIIAFANARGINANLLCELYDNQKIVINELMKIFTIDRIKDGTACCILNLRAGLGKTFVAAGIISRLKLRTLYIVPKRPLAKQAVDDLRACFYPAGDDNDADVQVGDKNALAKHITIGKFEKKAKKTDPSTLCANQDVTVIVIDSAMLRDDEFFRGYSLVILDEVHTYCSDMRKEIFKKCGSWVVFGMSATTEDRKDGFDLIAHRELAFDGIIRADDMPGFNYDGVEFDAEVTVVRYNGPPEFTENLTHPSTGKIFTPFMNKQFLRDPFRMSMVIADLRDLYNWVGPEGQRHCIYVFCEEVEPLSIVYRGFVETFGDGAVNAPEVGKAVDNNNTNAPPAVNGEHAVIGRFVGGIKDKIITGMRDNARIFLTTYGYSGTGVSIDKMTAIMFLTPRRANMKQILARILRRGGDMTVKRRVIDYVDNKTMIKYQLGDRLNAYRYYGMKVVEKKVYAHGVTEKPRRKKNADEDFDTDVKYEGFDE